MSQCRELIEKITQDRNTIIHEQENLFNRIKELEIMDRSKPAQPQNEPEQLSPIPVHRESENPIVSQLPQRTLPPQPSKKQSRIFKELTQEMLQSRPHTNIDTSPVAKKQPVRSRALLTPQRSTPLPHDTLSNIPPVARKLFPINVPTHIADTVIDIPNQDTVIDIPPEQRLSGIRKYVPPAFTGVANMPEVLPRQASQNPPQPELSQAQPQYISSGIQTNTTNAPFYQYFDKDKQKGLMKPLDTEKFMELSRPQRIIRNQYMLSSNRYKRKPHIINSR